MSLGIDAPEGLTASAAKEMAADGRLQAKVAFGRPITGDVYYHRYS